MTLLFCLLALVQPPTPPAFPSEVRVVDVPAFVTRDGQPVAGLESTDFEIVVDGVTQEVQVAAGPGAPVSAILVLDTSASVGGERLGHLKAAGQALLEGLASKDRATILTFSNEVHLVSPPSEDLAGARAALAAATSGGTTALFDAVYASLRVADRRHGRPLVLLFSDGEDRLSWLSADQVRAAAQEADLVLHAVGLAAPAPAASGVVPYLVDPRGDAARRAADPAAARRTDLVQDQSRGVVAPILKELADLTGGQVWRTDDGAQLREAFLGALNQARNSYLLQFEPRGVKPGGWHKLEVRLKARNGQVRARRGYHDGAL